MPALRETNPWLISGSLHGAVVFGALILFLARANLLSHDVEITLVDVPKPAPQAVEISKPKPKPQVVPRQIFGASRKSDTSQEGLDIKQGNTVAKAPDNDKLLPSDADSIPIPTEDYLVTAMPQLEREVVIPYPPAVKKRGVQGAVIMDLIIDSAGRVRKADLVEGPDPELNSAAVNAALGFKFRPAMVQNKPVAVKIRYAYKFVIRG
jgi:TonB family protein